MFILSGSFVKTLDKLETKKLPTKISVAQSSLRTPICPQTLLSLFIGVFYEDEGVGSALFY